MLDGRPLVVHADERVLHELFGDGFGADDQRCEAHHRLVALGEQIVEGHGRACAHDGTRVTVDGFGAHELGHHPVLETPKRPSRFPEAWLVAS